MDINLLPSQYRPRPWALPLTVMLILLILASVWGGYSFFQKKSHLQAEAAHIESEIAASREEMERFINDPEIKKYKQEIQKAEKELGRLKQMHKDLELFLAKKVEWGEVLDSLLDNAPQGLVLTHICQKANHKAEVLGKALSQPQALEYAKGLKDLAEVSLTFPRLSREIENPPVSFRLMLHFERGGRS